MARYELEVKSPIHIGNGETWNSFSDYIFLKNKLYLLNSEKIFEYLMDYERPKQKRMSSFEALAEAHAIPIEEYLNIIRNTGNKKGNIKSIIENYFNEKNISKDILSNGFVKKYVKQVIKVNSDIKNSNIGQSIKSANKSYIPGSSIKGAIRTAMIHRENIGKNKIDKDIFGKVISENKLKYLLVGDSSFIESDKISIEKTSVTHIHKVSTSILPVVCECINNGKTIFRVRTKGVNCEFDYLNEGNENALLSLVGEFYKKRLEDEIGILEKSVIKKDLGGVLVKYRTLLNNLKEGEYLIRLGANKTFYDQSIADLISDAEFNRLDVGNRDRFPLTRNFILDKNSKIVNTCGWGIIRRIKD